METNSKRSVAKSEKRWRGGYWTNERHLQYLNTVEASFVREWLNIDDDHNNNNITTSSTVALGSQSPYPPPRLDRYLPDSSESTLDLKSTHHLPRPRRHSASDILDQRGRRRLVTSQSRNACEDHDQVPHTHASTSN